MVAVSAALVLFGLGGVSSGFTLVDFSVDAAHRNPLDQHEVFFPDFNHFELLITGTFNTSKCYQVQIKRDGGSDCGSANSSGSDFVNGIDVTATSIRADISPTASADFKKATNWQIEVKERNGSCSGGSTSKIHPIRLKIAGCNQTCLLNCTDITANPNPTDCSGQTQLCASANGSGNYRYDWDTDGDGQYDDTTTYSPNNCISVALAATTTVRVKVTDLGTSVPNCFETDYVTVQVAPSNCNDNNPCTDDACVPGNGCVYTPDNSNACSDGQFCNGVETCSGGTCQPGTPPCAADVVACTVESCDEAHDTCEHTPIDGFCDDGLFCNGLETCDDVLGCLDGPDPCAPPTYCDEAGNECVQCLTDAHCDDGLFCNGAERCVNTVCVAGTPPDCDDAIACTHDACNEASDACTHAADNSLCTDGNACTDDTCVAGTGCVFTPDDSNACEDGDLCTLNDVCAAGACVGTPKDCSALNTQCRVGVCSPAGGDCVAQPANEGGACDDGLYCTVGETCAGGECGGSSPRNCDDGVSCTIDSCDEVNNTCVHATSNDACDDGLFCNGAETCHAVLGCQAGTNPCVDGVSCTVDTCDEANNACVYTPDDALCQDGLFCNGAEVCHADFGCQPGSNPCPADAVECTVDTCDESSDSCLHTPNHSVCQNGLFCDGVEVCDPAQGCIDGGDPCTLPLKKCDETNDRCVECLSDSQCDDGLYCNGAETCVNGVCQAGTPPNCNDAVACTVDSCDEANNVCTHAPNDSACQNGLFCDGVEVCNPASGCQDAADPCAPPLYCDEPGDRCVECLSNAHCDDGLWCNGAETCVNGTCQAGTPPNCDDGIACTADACDEAGDACVHVPNNGLCQNGLFCDGVEVCNPAGGCQDAA
ncbi:MAG: hypothetical protein HY763_10670, partial [Planctomycetes bacterium]|nr:hypothetical protein [Planctomycetota bacterium]